MDFFSLSMVESISFSVSSSNDEVNSSRISNLGFLIKDLANEILCLCPPESFFPPSPIDLLSSSKFAYSDN